MTQAAISSHPTRPPVDYSKKWWVLLAVGLALFLGSVDGSIVNVAVAPLMQSLHADFPTVQWVILSYLLTLTLLLVGMGRLADMMGKKRIFVTGIVVFLAGSILCGLAPNVYWLIGFRVLQAVGAAMLIALGTAILTEAWPPQQRGQVLGLAAGFISLGIVLGPVAGGLILGALSWRWIFYVNIPVGAISLLLALLYLPPMSPQNRRERFDFLGAVVMGGGLLAFTLAMTVGQNAGFTDPLILGLLAASLLMLAIFIVVERRVSYPIMDLSLFRVPAFSLNLFTATLAFVAISGVVLLLPIYLNLALGLDMTRVGLLMAAVPLVMVLLQPISGALSDRLGTRPVSLLGLFFILAGYLTMTTLQLDSSQVGFVWRMLPVSIGMSIFNSPNNSAIMGAVPRTRLGVASGILSMVRTLGQVTGIAALGAFFASRVVHYGSTELDLATPQAILLALHDQFFLVAALILAGIVVSALTWRWEIRTQAGKAPAPLQPMKDGSAVVAPADEPNFHA
ncbi:MAG: MFS transporter [Caldilineaceae bacterium]|mgnify:FL=1|jgi:EmrB/QacA subfamily drug resistance transporter|nr:MFS transporter [Caldilineaceae bacterium]